MQALLCRRRKLNTKDLLNMSTEMTYTVSGGALNSTQTKLPKTEQLVISD